GHHPDTHASAQRSRECASAWSVVEFTYRKGVESQVGVFRASFLRRQKSSERAIDAVSGGAFQSRASNLVVSGLPPAGEDVLFPEAILVSGTAPQTAGSAPVRGLFRPGGPAGPVRWQRRKTPAVPRAPRPDNTSSSSGPHASCCHRAVGNSRPR